MVAIGVLVMAQLFGLIGVIVAIPLLSLAIILVEELGLKPQEASALEVDGAGARGAPAAFVVSAVRARRGRAPLGPECQRTIPVRPFKLRCGTAITVPRV